MNSAGMAAQAYWPRAGCGVRLGWSVDQLARGWLARRRAAEEDFGREVLTEQLYNRMVVSMDPAFNADMVFAALADATRRDIVLRALAGREGVAELAGHFPMSFAAVQKHVAVLERAGLVTKERTGRRKVVRTNVEGLQLARGLLDQYEALWRGRVERMTDLITSTEGDNT
jgi:DNA-binding transcriptional ArsR family regulator